MQDTENRLILEKEKHYSISLLSYSSPNTFFVMGFYRTQERFRDTKNLVAPSTLRQP